MSHDAASPTEGPRSTTALEPGATINGRYRVARVLGTGAFGRVYLAEDIDVPSNPLLAIKELLTMEFGSTEERHDAINWFKREVSALLNLEHPGIPAIHSYWTANRTSGPMYLAMDYIPGKTLAELLAEAQDGMPWRQVVTWGVELCNVLEYMHGRTPPFVFRDIKPANILLNSRTNSPVLIDFGLARQLVPVGGTSVGTWGFVPFEQVLGKAEPRSDLYALGATLHALISGRHPDAEYRRLLRSGLDVEGAMRSLFPPLTALVAGLPVALSHAIACATSYDAEDRFPNAAAMATALHGALATRRALVVPGPVAASEAAATVVWAGGQGPTTKSGSSGELESSDTDLVRPPSGDVSQGQVAPLDEQPAVETRAKMPVSLESLPAMEPIAVEAPAAPRGAPTPVGSAATPADSAATANQAAAAEDAGRKSKWRLKKGKGSTPEDRRAGRGSAVSITVSARGNGQFRSIDEAIRHAQPGARIDVEPGVYVEGLVIDRPVEIVGVGPLEEIIVEATTSSCVLMQAETAIMRNMTLRGRSTLGGERFYTVNIPTGRLLMEDCHIVSEALACVAIHGENTNPILKRCILRNNIDRALAIYDLARGSIEQCDITAGTVPVRISSFANPTLRRCRIHDGQQGGVLVTDRGKGVLEECEIVDNGHHGVAIRQGSFPTITRCRINRNGWNGISIVDTSGATVTYCDLTGNKRSAWDVKESAKLMLDRMGNIES